MNLDLGICNINANSREGYHCSSAGCVANCPNGPAVVYELPEIIVKPVKDEIRP